jgi:hypothetical protein
MILSKYRILKRQQIKKLQNKKKTTLNLNYKYRAHIKLFFKCLIQLSFGFQIQK